jgi:transposase
VWESRLKKEPFFTERDEEKRKAFDEEVSKIPDDVDIVYIDECGVKEDIARLYGRSPKGERVYLPTNGKSAKKLNIIAALVNGRIICPTFYDWNTNTVWFLVWLEWFLFPLLKAGSVIILDNASFHKKSEVYRIAAFYGCSVIFLPTYSPDKNKIEKLWANLKNWLRLNRKSFGSIREAVTAYYKTE